MALPSERITIKRRREDEPVEALHLPQKRNKSDICWNLVTNFQSSDVPLFLPSVSCKPNDAVHDATDISQVPKIRLTSPKEDFLSECASNFEAVQRYSAGTQNPPRTSSRPKGSILTSSKNHGQKRSDVSGSSTGPRRFHFIKNSSFASLHTIGPAKRVEKHRKSRRGDLPVFIEETGSTPQRRSDQETRTKINDETSKDHFDSPPIAQSLDQRQRKRPMVSAVEQKWRTENWANSTIADRDIHGTTKTAQSIDEPSSQWDYSSEVLAAQLQQVTSHEINLTTAFWKNTRNSLQLKVQPKPPKPRQPNLQQHADAFSEDVSLMDTSEDGNEDDYVYDTYVRSVGRPAGASVKPSEGDMGCLQSIDHSKIGILIIAEEDQKEWETFAEVDQDSDKDWNSEEEDENAEDFYGNDYPEDEVKSDDEFDEGAYRYRTGPSDEEEFDHDIESWSDEDDARYPWKHNVGIVQRVGDNDNDRDMNT